MAIETDRFARAECGSIISRGWSNRLSGSVRPISVPLWLGAERPGVELGPAALDAGLRARWHARALPHLEDRLAPTVTVPVDVPADARERLNQRSLTFLPQIAEACERLADEVEAAVTDGELALILGGDHALSAGSIAGAALAASPEPLGVLWLDTHPDLNTAASSPSGHIHGMPLAASLGLGETALTDLGHPGPKLRPEHVCLLGAQDIDPGERELIHEQGIWLLTMEEWSDAGILSGLDDALIYLECQGVGAVHISFDLDVLDPLVLPGTGTTIPGGLTYRESSQVLRRLRDWDGSVRSVDWVELNPSLDPSGHSVETAVALLATMLGETMR